MMRNGIPECYEADRQAEARELAWTARVMKRPRCERCGKPLTGETYLDLEPFGLNGCACERCVSHNTRDIGDLDEDYA